MKKSLRATLLPAFVVALCLVLSAGTAAVAFPGQQIWVRQTGGHGNVGDAAMGLVTDGAGNSYVTGWTKSTATGYDVLTIKYDKWGTAKWSRHYTGYGAHADKGYAIARDANCYIYVAGKTTVSGRARLCLLKYSASGSLIWAHTYDPPGEGFGRVVLTIDGNGNPCLAVTTGANTAPSCETVVRKYTPAGSLVWSRTFDRGGMTGAADIARDGSNSIYVVGSVCYGLQNDIDGYVLKYDSAGIKRWEKWDPVPLIYGPWAVTVSSGKVYVAGSFSAASLLTDACLAGYDAGTGHRDWFATIAGTDHSMEDHLGDIGIRNGYLYATGNVHDTAGGDNWLTAKYSTGGVQKWVQKYDGPAGGADKAEALALDANGNAYATGRCTVAGGNVRITTIKYTNGGAQAWASILPNAVAGSDAGLDVSLSPGAVYVCGVTQGASTGADFTTVKYAQ